MDIAVPLFDAPHRLEPPPSTAAVAVNRECVLVAPINCRGMTLLGLMSGSLIQFCVHQVSVELWRLYDTPRVSIQKKIADLGIQLSNSSREQIRLLREAGIIQNFRATMISLRDTERLFDALEQSRRKRGLLKHALKVKAGPLQRSQRVEEKIFLRLSARTYTGRNGASLSAMSPPIVPVFASPAPCPPIIGEWAPNGVGGFANGGNDGFGADVSWCDAEPVVILEEEGGERGELLVAGEASPCGINGCELAITVEQNNLPVAEPENRHQGSFLVGVACQGGVSFGGNCQMITEVASPQASLGNNTSTTSSACSASLQQSQEDCPSSRSERGPVRSKVNSPGLEFGGLPEDSPSPLCSNSLEHLDSASPQTHLTSPEHASLHLVLSSDDELNSADESDVFVSPSQTPPPYDPDAVAQLPSSLHSYSDTLHSTLPRAPPSSVWGDCNRTWSVGRGSDSFSAVKIRDRTEQQWHRREQVEGGQCSEFEEASHPSGELLFHHPDIHVIIPPLGLYSCSFLSFLGPHNFASSQILWP